MTGGLFRWLVDLMFGKEPPMPRPLQYDEVITIRRYEVCPACKSLLIETPSARSDTAEFLCTAVECGTAYMVGTGRGIWGFTHASDVRRRSLAWDDSDVERQV